LERLVADWPPLVRRPAVRAALSITDTTQKSYEKAGKLPPPIALSARRLVYEKDGLIAALARLLGGGVVA
jgi:hypothetical protein